LPQTLHHKENKVKRGLLILLLSFAALAFPAYPQQKNLNIVFIPKSSDQVFWKFMRNGVDDALRENGNVTLTWRGPAYNDDSESQINILQMYSRPGVDAIIIVPTDRVRLAEPVKKAALSGIKVVVVDSAVDGEQHQNFITTDNHAGGRLAAKHLAGVLNGRGRVLVFRTVAGSASTDDRANGFIDYIKENAPQITIIADEYGGGSRGKSLHSATELLKAETQIDGIFAVNESASDGMLRALRHAGRAGKTKFVGFDSTDFLLDGLEKGEIHALVVQNPRQMGYLGMQAAIAAANGIPVPDRIIHTDAIAVTRGNLRDPDILKLLIP
jgi:ribose transport system substrate-binding protein